MFSQAKSKSARPEASQLPVPTRSSRGEPSAPSIISGDILLNGNVSTSGDIHIDGEIRGNVRARSLTIGATAVLTGDIVAEDVTVYGRVVGHVTARRVRLCTKSRVEGDIWHESLTVEDGAFFEGNCRHKSDPLKSEASLTAPKLLAGSRDETGRLRTATKDANEAASEGGAPTPSLFRRSN